MIDMYLYENELKGKGVKYIGGTDEAGRGPLFGPVVAACVYLPDNYILLGINDSKKLTEKKREELYEHLIKEVIYGVGIIEACEIDEINILEASRKAMTLAVEQVRKQVSLEHVLTDAMRLDIDIPHTAIIKGDAKSASIAAASIIAKVTRDHILYEFDKKYPEYEFKKHKGYPTKKHMELIREYGLIDGYRKSYGPVKELLNENR